LEAIANQTMDYYAHQIMEIIATLQMDIIVQPATKLIWLM
jgi:hypothetical protein